ncbi:hypothetical protein [Collinsella sp. TF11-5AC]|uniref:hypothetical protein n=1 Tax=Collinsella sp. TF11-5AC TaxID=2292336 RepID=UPI0013143062|nr:hypothetical protein [Collinsella sp. TF11-5AC]
MVNDLGSMDDLELMPLGGGYMVRRERLMNELLAKGRKAGIVVLYAPDGFGKTSVLLQYTHEVKCDPTRGPVRIIEADRATGREVFMQLEVVTEELKDKPHSLIAIDNVPNLDQHDTEDLIDRIRGLRAMGVGVFISCRPSNRQLIHGLGDSVKINAQMLKVHAYEYSAWASAFSISTSLDFYQLTQGVPELVSALQTGLYGQGDVAGLLENEIVNVYGAALVDLASLDNNALFCVACLMILMGEGNIAELEACGVRLSMVDQSYFVRDYPIFGLDPAERSFTCLGTEDNGRLRLRKLVAEVRPELVPRAARILLKAGRCDAAMGLADAFLDRDAVLELAGQYGVDLALTGHGGRYLPSSAGHDRCRGSGSRANACRGAWRISGSGQRVQYKARSLYGIGHRARGRTGGLRNRPCFMEGGPDTDGCLLWGQRAWASYEPDRARNRDIPYRTRYVVRAYRGQALPDRAGR